MASVTVQVRATIAWWARPFLKLWCAWVFVTGRMPDDSAIRRFASRATKVEVI